MKQETLLWIIIGELALLLFGLYSAAQQVQQTVASNPVTQILNSL